MLQAIVRAIGTKENTRNKPLLNVKAPLGGFAENADSSCLALTSDAEGCSTFGELTIDSCLTVVAGFEGISGVGQTELAAELS